MLQFFCTGPYAAGIVTVAWISFTAYSVAGNQGDVPALVRTAEQERIAVMAKALQAAVSIFAADGSGGGSGVVISPDGYALSNYHVVSPVGDFMKCGMADGRIYDAVIVSMDPTGDVALIKLFGREDFPYAEMGDSDQVCVGDWCFAVGNPFLLATDLQPSVSYGIVSGIHRYQEDVGGFLEYTDCLQTDAAINPGNSGGPLFDAQGRLIGINGRCSFEKRGRVNVGVGYAISVSQIRNFLGHLRSGRIVDHATLGATVAADADGRVVVSNILESSDAYRRGLRYGDELLAFAGQPLRSANEFKNVLGILPRGWRVPLSYRRDGVRREIHVRLAGVHSPEELLALIQQGTRPGELPPEKRPRRGEKPPEKPPRKPERPPARKVAIPGEFAQYIQPRPGFANYYFNELQRKQVWDRWRDRGDFSGLSGTWKLVGKTAGSGPVELALGDSESSAQLSESRCAVSADKDLSDQLQPEGSGGLVAALHLWRRLLVHGPERFGEVYYLGTAPLIGRQGLFDVLVAVHNVTESHFSFDPASGYLVSLEMYPDSGVDPCEVAFADYRVVKGRSVPHRLTVRHGDTVFADIQWEQIVLPDSDRPAT